MYDELLSKIRLKQFEIEAIVQCFLEFFLSADHILIFGSRVDKSRRGGDIDLYVETNLSAGDAHLWREMRKARNIIEHEYPDNPELMAKTLNEIVTLTPLLLDINNKLFAKINEA